MNSSVANQYRPDVVYPPGDTLRELLDERGMSQAELARAMGRTTKAVNELVQARVQLTPETAIGLEHVFGAPAGFWNVLEANYREFLARQREAEVLEQSAEWVRQFPVREMVRRKLAAPAVGVVDRIRCVLRYFAVASPEQWEAKWGESGVAFRCAAHAKNKRGLVATWLRQGELAAHRADPPPYDPKAFRSALTDARALTVEEPDVFQPELKRLCAAAGVVVLFVPEYPGAGVSGATYWVRSGTRPVVQLSLRYKTDDQLWFSFFHEAAHVLLHGRTLFVEGRTGKSLSDDERAADRFAADTLIPPADWARLCQHQRYSELLVGAEARRIGVAPGVVVGRLQHEGRLPRSHLNGLKVRLVWVAT